MIKEEYEEKFITEKKKVLVKRITICDCCGKEIQGEYFEAFSGHDEWGADSGDSYEHNEYCSLECLMKAIEEFYTTGYGKNYRNSFYNIEKGMVKEDETPKEN